jgi:hypothetical protein
VNKISVETKMIVTQLLKNFDTALLELRWFIILFIRARHWDPLLSEMKLSISCSFYYVGNSLMLKYNDKVRNIVVNNFM